MNELELQNHDIAHLRCYYDGEISPLGTRVLKCCSIIFGGLHNTNSNILKKTNWADPYCISITTVHSLSTYDDNRLTVLVLLAHDMCVRIEITSCNFNYIKIMFHQRTRTGNFMSRHPSIEDVLKKWRKND